MPFCPRAALPVLLTALFALTAQAAQLAADSEHSLPFGRRVPEATARRIARTTAWLDALAKATDALSAARLVRCGAEGATGREALASAVVTPAVSSASQGGQVAARVRLATPQRTVEDRLRKMLPEREMLALRSEMLALEKEKAEEGRRLIKLALSFRRTSAGESAANEARMVLLGKELEALWLLGLALPQREGGRWRDRRAALSLLQQAEALYPEYAPLHYLLGEILLQLDRPQDALEGLDKALALNPELAGALYARGLAYMRLQLPMLAERDLSAALARNASHAAWWRARGVLHMIRGEIGPMCEDFLQACAKGDCEGLAHTRERDACPAEK